MLFASFETPVNLGSSRIATPLPLSTRSVLAAIVSDTLASAS